MDTFQINKESYNDIKASFIRSFEPKHSTKTVCYNFQDLKQRECAFYFACNLETFKRFMSSKLSDMSQAVWVDDEHSKFCKDDEVEWG